MKYSARVFSGEEIPRTCKATRHNLHDTPMIAKLFVIFGVRPCTDMKLFGRSKEEFLRRVVTLGDGIPCQHAFSTLTAWGGRPGRDAIDGKTLRRSFCDPEKRLSLYIVSAFATVQRLTLGRVKLEGKSNEVTAMLALPEHIDIEAPTLTVDAMHTHRAPAGAVTAKGSDYVQAKSVGGGGLVSAVAAGKLSPGGHAD